MNGDTLISACVIHRRDYRNTSLLLELFTPDEGRVPAIAKGAKSGRATRAALLQPFTPLVVALRGRGEIKQLLQVEADGRAYTLTGERLYCGFYLNELLMRLLERRDPYPRLYVHYVETLQRLSSGEMPDQCLRNFEVDLLQELGYGMLLDHTADSGEAIQPERLYHYELEQGPMSQASASKEQQIHGRTLLCLHNRERLDGQSAVEAKRLLRRILAFYLGDKPLKSRELFQGLK
ncbi:MAG: DNA repair protein RecO [Chromatiales bacterium]